MKYYKSEVDKEILDSLEGIDINKILVENGSWKISVFTSLFDSQGALDKLWQDISSVLASTFQVQLKGRENEFEKWNIYIIYVCKEEVDKTLKNKIENNKFSSRKIVEDKFDGELTDERVNEFIIKHITNTDLQVIVESTIENTELDYEPVENNLWEIIPKDSLISHDTKLQKDLLEQIKTI